MRTIFNLYCSCAVVIMSRFWIYSLVLLLFTVKLEATKKIEIFKCCPHNELIKGRKCVTLSEARDFKNTTVYSEDIEDTGRKVEDVFQLLPGKFYIDSFQNASINIEIAGFRTYVIETGVLMLEMPNVYAKRWTPIDKDHFCIDYIIKDGKISTTPKIWVDEIPGIESFEESSTFWSITMLFSSFFLLLVLIVYFLLPELQNLCGLILMAYVGSLFMAFLFLATIQLGRYVEEVCLGLTYCIYFFLLSSFCWMSVMSYDIWWTFRGYAKARPIHRRGERFKFCMYGLCAWGLPFAVTVAFAIVNSADMSDIPWFVIPNIPKKGCFLEGEAKLFYLYIPMLILILCNWFFYLMTAFNVWRLNRGTAVLDSAAAGTPAAHRTQRHRFMVYLKLSAVMGLSWLLEIVSFVWPGFSLWYISDAYNILMGPIIFLIFVCKTKIYRKLYKRYGMSNMRRYYPGSAKSYSSSNSNSDSGPETASLQVCSHPKGQNGLPMKSV